ncbi:hypothetical protein [Acidithiobacillus ferrooxidans]|uniref:hypothetical protein n=1 Tax=Acidithiobacillus ferrooxidans TaxID=920 RepID=UPI0013D31313|nr:hypothetical protein [Acidithiobacillus ferrooxidans]
MKKIIIIELIVAAIAVGVGFVAAPAFAETAGIAAKAALPYSTIPSVSGHGKIVVSDFAPKREHKLVFDAEAVAFSGHIGQVEASCHGEKIAITPADEAERLPVLDAQIYRACPGHDLTVTIATTN